MDLQLDGRIAVVTGASRGIGLAVTQALAKEGVRVVGAARRVSSELKVNSRVPATGPVGYSEAKAALTALSKRLSEELGRKGVRVNTVSPGVVATCLWRGPDSFGAEVAAANGVGHEEFLSTIPQRFGMASPRITEPAEVAALVPFVVSGAANIVGSDVVIDGGTLKAS